MKSGRRVSYKKTFFPFADLINILEFSLNNTFVKGLNGRILHQAKGIPMGDPHSPGMTILTCAWMEMEWMQSLSLATKENFMAKRYMDDILCFYRKSEDWDYKAFISDFERSECYMSPLHLEDANQQTFLETTFTINPGTIDIHTFISR